MPTRVCHETLLHLLCAFGIKCSHVKCNWMKLFEKLPLKRAISSIVAQNKCIFQHSGLKCSFLWEYNVNTGWLVTTLQSTSNVFFFANYKRLLHSRFDFQFGTDWKNTKKNQVNARFEWNEKRDCAIQDDFVRLSIGKPFNVIEITGKNILIVIIFPIDLS